MNPVRSTAFALTICCLAMPAVAAGTSDVPDIKQPAEIHAFSSFGPAREAADGQADADQAFSVYETLEDTSAIPVDQPFCDVHAEMGLILEEQFGERPIDAVTEVGGAELSLWASATAGTWTLLHRDDGGISCVVSSGYGWTSDSTVEQIIHAAGFEPENGAGQLIAGVDMR